MARGDGAYMYDVDGNRFIDWMAGIAVNSTGYQHPVVTKAVQDAAASFLHICGTDFYYQGFSDLCEALAKSAPGGGKWRTFRIVPCGRSPPTEMEAFILALTRKSGTGSLAGR